MSWRITSEVERRLRRARRAMRWRVLGSRRRVSGDAIVKRLDGVSVTQFVIQNNTGGCETVRAWLPRQIESVEIRSLKPKGTAPRVRASTRPASQQFTPE